MEYLNAHKYPNQNFLTRRARLQNRNKWSILIRNVKEEKKHKDRTLNLIIRSLYKRVNIN